MTHDAVATDVETSPEEAKNVWDSLESPTIEKVHERLTMAGKKVKLSTIAYWFHENWMRPSVEDVAAAIDNLDTKVPLVTGNPRNGVKSIVPGDRQNEQNDKPALRPDKRVRSLPFGKSLEELADDKLMRSSIREGFIAAAVIFREVRRQRKELLKNPVELGSLMKSLSDVLDKCTTCADRSATVSERLMRVDEIARQRTLDVTPHPNGHAPEPDRMETVLSNFRRGNGSDEKAAAARA